MKRKTPFTLWPQFGGEKPFGSREHYFHFLLGYLLPGLFRSLGRGHSGTFLSCGPLMDPLIHQACALLGLDARIDRGDSSLPDARVPCPRWDQWLTHPNRKSAVDRLGDMLPGSTRRQLAYIRRQLLDAANSQSSTVFTGNEEWLLLRRSPPHTFYHPQGAAQYSGYGTERRAIQNLPQLATAMTDAGLSVRIYEPGVHTLDHQIRTFHNARGVVGVRGAEFANLVWMRKGAHALMLATPISRENNASRNLAAVRGIHFSSLSVDGSHSHVNPDRLMAALSKHLDLV